MTKSAFTPKMLACVFAKCTVSYTETQTPVIGMTVCFHVVRRNGLTQADEL